MVRKWSYLKDLSINDSSFWEPHFKSLSKRHTFKVFRKTTRFKRYSIGLSTVVRLKTMKITRKTEKLTLSTFISSWSKVYLRSKQFYRYYQAIGLFNVIVPTFSPDAVKSIILKTNPVVNIFYFSCSKNVLKKYLTEKLSDKKIKSPINHSRNCYVAATGLKDLKDFDKISSSILFLDENFYLPKEVLKTQQLKLQTYSILNNSILSNSLISVKIIRQILIKMSLIIISTK